MHYLALLHVYYEDQLADLLRVVTNLQQTVRQPVEVVATYPSSRPALAAQTPSFAGEIRTVATPDYGKDIAPFLRVLQQACLDHPREEVVCLKLHTKRSSHATGVHATFGDTWRNTLLQGLGEPSAVAAHLSALATANVGASGVCPYLVQGEEARNAALLAVYRERLHIHPEACNGFYAGSMFYFKLAAYRTQLRDWFASTQAYLQCEPGDVRDAQQGTHTHSWERLLGWLVRNVGYDLAAPVDLTEAVTQTQPLEQQPDWMRVAAGCRLLEAPQPFFTHRLR